MTHNSPIDDNIPRDPGRNDSDADGSLHDSHWHDTSPDESPSNEKSDAPRCGNCGHDRTGISPDADCPNCLKRQQSPRCTFCGYELSGLLVTQSCPECGKPIWDSNIRPPTSGLSIASLVLGIVSIASCILYGMPALITGPLAIIFGEIAVRQYKSGARGGNTKGFALTGRICGWIGFIIALFVLCGFLVLIYF